MGRENKFRVWDDVEKKMWYPGQGLKACITQIGQVCVDETDNDGTLENKNYRLIALFYTGLKDKNGKEIYEGDIVRFYFSADYPLVTEPDDPSNPTEMIDGVTFEEGCFCFYNYDVHAYSFAYRWNNRCEVIGNTYENPELLKEVETNGKH